jgi:hypothetical protein
MVDRPQGRLPCRVLDAVEAEWSNIPRTVRARMLAVLSRAAQRLPHLTAHDAGAIDREVRTYGDQGGFG